MQHNDDDYVMVDDEVSLLNKINLLEECNKQLVVNNKDLASYNIQLRDTITNLNNKLIVEQKDYNNINSMLKEKELHITALNKTQDELYAKVIELQLRVHELTNQNNISKKHLCDVEAFYLKKK